MAIEKATARVIVVANEKGGSGKSTVAMHIAVALIKSGQRVATLDLDFRQKSFTHYIENRRAWAAHVGRDLGTPDHTCFDQRVDYPTEDDEAAACKALTDTVDALAASHDFIVIDTPDHDSDLMRGAPSDGRYLDRAAQRQFRRLRRAWFHRSGNLQRHRHQPLRRHGGGGAQPAPGSQSRGHRLDRFAQSLVYAGLAQQTSCGEVLRELSQRLDFRCTEGLAERVIFREFYPRGLTAVDDLDEITLGARPTMSHMTARLEIEALLNTLRLGSVMDSGGMFDESHDAAAA